MILIELNLIIKEIKMKTSKNKQQIGKNYSSGWLNDSNVTSKNVEFGEAFAVAYASISKVKLEKLLHIK